MLMRSLVLSFVLSAWAGSVGARYSEWAEEIREARLKNTVEVLSSVGSRVVGYPGHEEAARYILKKFKEIGLQGVRTEEFEVTVPVDHGASLEILDEGRRIKLYGLWPNLVRTPTLPVEGIRAKLVYGRSGKFKDLNGKDLEGKVVLLDFNTRDRWINVAMLGAKAIIFIEPDSTIYTEAEDKFLSVPLSTPRFWISKEDASHILRRLEEGELEVRMWSRMTWEKVPAYNILGWIPGTDPVLRNDIIVLEAYYDAMSVVPSLAPGAEMASGIAALLELARFFRNHPPARTLLFLATTAHHMELRGVDDFLQRHDRKVSPFIKRMTESFNRYDEKTGEEKEEPGPTIKLFVGLDLSTKTDELGVWNSSTSFYYKRYFAPFGKKFIEISRNVCQELGRDPSTALVNGISPEGGRSWETYVPGEISVDSELALAVGTPALSFVTVNDARFVVDTPLDTPDKVDFGNLARQTKLLACVFKEAFDDPELFPDFRMRLKDELMTLHGSVMVYPRRGFVPDRPRKDAVAVLLTGRRKSYKGVRGNFFELVDDEGRFTITRIRVRNVELHAFYMDPLTGDITYAPDRGVQGDKAYPIKFTMDWRDKRWMIVVFPCIATDFYDVVDPRYLSYLSQVTVFDEADSEPEEFGYFISQPTSQTMGHTEVRPVGVVFTRPGTRVKLGLGAGLLGFRLLLLNSLSAKDPEVAKGKGYLTDKPGSFAYTSFLAARDMWNLDEARINQLKKYAIENHRLSRLHRKAKRELDLAEKAMKERRWDEFIKHTRAALGIESRAYPDVKSTQNDVIRGIIFFMALVLPAAYFGERLLFAFPDIRKQIAGFAAIFAVIWVLLWLVHPAFQLSNPFVVLLAFVILALAGLVIAIITSKFSQQMRKRQTETSLVHETDVGRVSASYAAFTLGISNMRRRKTRTALTFVTLLLLTFTVLSFTSIKTTLKFTRISRDNIGLYEGALIRNRSWNPLEESAYEYTLSSFEDIATIAPRNWYISRQKAYIEVASERKVANALGVLGMTPQEDEITGIAKKCLVAGRWFKEGEAMAAVLPVEMMDLLDIDLSEVGRAKVRLFGRWFTVIGALDSKKMKILKDLDDELLTPADFQLTGGQAVQEMVEEERRAKEGMETPKLVIKPFVHLEPANVIIIPYETLRGAGGALESIAVRFREGVDVRKEIEDFVSRLAVTLFAGIREKGEDFVRVYVYSSMGATSLSGLSNLFVPILIAALIVLNTMMGSVYERTREIGIYSSVGLAPVHVAFLFLAESAVYAVLGTVAGYLVGQITAKVLFSLNLLKGFTLNYSSLSAVMSAALVMAVVLLSTVYPARKASQMAVPDVTRRWKLPEPEGDHWFFEFPFTVGGEDVFGLYVFLVHFFDAYSEESIGIFYTDGAKLKAFPTEKGEGYLIDVNVWLAPFDLGVSQRVQFRAVPTGDHNIYRIEVGIDRLSGEHASWKRVNQRFMNVIRKQFLIWRTVTPEAKEEYRKEGRRMLEGQRQVA